MESFNFIFNPMSKVHRRQKSLSLHKTTAEGVSKRHRSRERFYTTSNNNEMLLFLSAFKLNTQSWFTQETVPLTEQKQWDRTPIHAPQLVQLQYIPSKYLLQPQPKASAKNKPQKGENKTKQQNNDLCAQKIKPFSPPLYAPNKRLPGRAAHTCPFPFSPWAERALWGHKDSGDTQTGIMGTYRQWPYTDRDCGDTQTVRIHRQGR